MKFEKPMIGTPPFVSSPSLMGERDLIALCERNLSRNKIPRSFEFRSDLPRTETGKLFKEELIKDYLLSLINDQTKRA